MTPDTFGSVLKSLRDRADLSQQELATKAQVSVTSIQNWESDRRVPRRAEFRRLAAALGMSSAELKARGDGEAVPSRPVDAGALREELMLEISGLREEIEYLNPRYERNRPLLVAHLERQISELQARVDALSGEE